MGNHLRCGAKHAVQSGIRGELIEVARKQRAPLVVVQGGFPRSDRPLDYGYAGALFFVVRQETLSKQALQRREIPGSYEVP